LEKATDDLARLCSPGHSEDAARAIILAVSRYYDVSWAQIMSAKRLPRITLARSVALYLVRVDAGWSYSECGRFFGRPCATALQACQRIAGRLDADSAFATELERIRAMRTLLENEPKGRKELARARPAGDTRLRATIPTIRDRKRPAWIAVIVAGDVGGAALSAYLQNLSAGTTVVTYQLFVAELACEQPLHVVHMMGSQSPALGCDEPAAEERVIGAADQVVIFGGALAKIFVGIAQRLGKPFLVFAPKPTTLLA
jgi:hypothetical protein